MHRLLRYLLIGGSLAALLLAIAACTGEVGPQGAQGPQGAAGAQGVAGAAGAQGPAGAQGVAGPQGVVGATGAQGPAGAKGGFAAPAASKQHFDVTAIEIKGSTDKLAAPTINPTTLSDGYGYKGPGVFDATNPSKWEVSSYIFTPGAMAVYQGDTVDFTLFIINGDKHVTWVEAPNGTSAVAEFEMNRGREYKKSFTASQVGTYKLICTTHDPTMMAHVLVLPR